MGQCQSTPPSGNERPESLEIKIIEGSSNPNASSSPNGGDGVDCPSGINPTPEVRADRQTDIQAYRSGSLLTRFTSLAISPQVLKNYAHLGEAANAKMDYSSALHYFYLARDGFEKIHGVKSHGGDNSIEVVELEFLIASAKDELGECDEALTLYREVLKKQEKVFGLEDERTLTTLNNTGWSLYENKLYEESKEHYEKCLERKINVFGENHAKSITTMNR